MKLCAVAGYNTKLWTVDERPDLAQYLVCDDEVVRVAEIVLLPDLNGFTSRDRWLLKVERSQLGTDAARHQSDTPVFRVGQYWDTETGEEAMICLEVSNEEYVATP